MIERDGRVLPATRALSITIIPFLVVAFVVLFVYPDDTRRLFAWPISPRMTPMVLGSVYLGGAYFFLRAARAREWHRVKAGFVPVGTFASLMAIATVIHRGPLHPRPPRVLAVGRSLLHDAVPGVR